MCKRKNKKKWSEAYREYCIGCGAQYTVIYKHQVPKIEDLIHYCGYRMTRELVKKEAKSGS